MDVVPHVANGFCEQVLGISPSLLAMKFKTYLLKGGQSALALGAAKDKDIRAQVNDLLRISFSNI